MKRKIISQVLLLSCAGLAFATQNVKELLDGYLKNSLDLHKLSSQVEKQILNSKVAQISNGMNIQLSTGEIQFQLGSDQYFTFSPKAAVTIPQADNLGFSASSVVNINDSQEKTVSDISLSISADIYSGAMEQRKITLLESERTLLEAKRALQNGFVSAEKEFYSSLKNLYEIASQIIKEEKNLYEDKLSFEKIRAQGYSSGSTTYRLSQNKVLADEHSVQVYRHKLERETRIFAAKCGVYYSEKDPVDFLPQEIPEVEGIDVFSFKKDTYAKIENASWKKHINTLKRDAEKSMTLSANAGCTFDKEIKGSYHNTVDAGLSYTWDKTALTAKAGVSFPVDSINPVYSLGLTLIPNQFRLASIDSKLEEEDVRQEEIDIKSAHNDYITSLASQKSSLDNILWNKNANIESYDMYTSLAKDTALYFERGIISESEYKSAQVNKENYRIQILINNLDLIIYNDETRLLFTRDEELENVK